MQTINIDVPNLAAKVVALWWPVIRVSGFVLAAPVVSSTALPARVKVMLIIGLGFLFSPLIAIPAGLSVFSGAGAVAAVQELLIGVSIGLVVSLAFEAFTLAGQAAAMTMGLGYATLIDPQHGANTTVLGQMLTIFATLTYLAMDGHLVLFGVLANSFQTLPIGGAHVDGNFLMSLALWGGGIFESGLLIALPAIVAIVIVNLALGVVTRAAPQLNLFGVGFPITLLGGFFVLFTGFDGIMAGVSSVLHGALAAAAEFASGPGRAVP
jgi:flagellar biosynthetic protein FliR